MKTDTDPLVPLTYRALSILPIMPWNSPAWDPLSCHVSFSFFHSIWNNSQLFLDFHDLDLRRLQVTYFLEFGFIWCVLVVRFTFYQSDTLSFTLRTIRQCTRSTRPILICPFAYLVFLSSTGNLRVAFQCGGLLVTLQVQRTQTPKVSWALDISTKSSSNQMSLYLISLIWM